jgi:hypothetical protein
MGNRVGPPGRRNPGEQMEAQTVIVTPEYFRTLGIKLVSGRPFTDGDTQGAPAVVIINESLARHLSPYENPLGNQLDLEETQYPGPDSVHPRTAQIVGVVGDSKQWGVTEPLHNVVYVPFAQNPAPSMFVVAKTQIHSSALVDSIRTAVSELDPDQPVYDVQMMKERIRASESERRFNATLLVLFAGLALVATAIGIYGTLAFWVAQRTHEIGVRMALGAGTREVLSLVVRKIARLMFVGIALGLPASFAMVRLIRSFVYGGQPGADIFYGVSSVDPVTMLAVLGVLIGSGVASHQSRLGARIASRIISNRGLGSSKGAKGLVARDCLNEDGLAETRRRDRQKRSRGRETPLLGSCSDFCCASANRSLIVFPSEWPQTTNLPSTCEDSGSRTETSKRSKESISRSVPVKSSACLDQTEPVKRPRSRSWKACGRAPRAK